MNDLQPLKFFETLLDCTLNRLYASWRFIPTFPKPQRINHQLFFSVSQITAWAKTHDVQREVSHATTLRKKMASPFFDSRPNQPNQRFNQLATKFFAGQYLPEQQKQQIEFKKLVARNTQPKTQRQTLVFEWMLDEGPLSKYRRAAHGQNKPS
jgi:hypothetical protein